MNLEGLEDEILHLSKKDRIDLMQKLVLSLGAPSKAELREVPPTALGDHRPLRGKELAYTDPPAPHSPERSSDS